MIGRLRGAYGEGPLHLVAHLAALAAIGYAVVQLAQARSAINAFAWLIGAALVHDLLLAPAYTAADRLLRRVLPRLRVPVVNHVRFALAIPGVLLLVWFPLILRRAPDNYERVAGHPPADYLGRWLAVSGAIVLVSALTYAVRVARAGRIEHLDEPVRPSADEHPPRA